MLNSVSGVWGVNTTNWQNEVIEKLFFGVVFIVLVAFSPRGTMCGRRADVARRSSGGCAWFLLRALQPLLQTSPRSRTKRIDSGQNKAQPPRDWRATPVLRPLIAIKSSFSFIVIKIIPRPEPEAWPLNKHLPLPYPTLESHRRRGGAKAHPASWASSAQRAWFPSVRLSAFRVLASWQRSS